MKTTLLFLLACTFLLSSNTFYKNHLNEKYSPFKVYIEQDGIRLPITNNEVSLDKKPFRIVFVFDKPNGILISTSFNKATYEMAIKNEPLAKLPGYQGTGMAEYLFNNDKEVLVDDSAPSYWFFDNIKEHRFNTVKTSKDSLVCTREIKQFNIFDEKGNIILPIEKVSKALYFVFIDYISDPQTYKKTELQREMIKINWK